MAVELALQDGHVEKGGKAIQQWMQHSKEVGNHKAGIHKGMK